MMSFSVAHTDSSGHARVGMLKTPHAVVDTPAFMPVGSLGTVKGISPEELQACGFKIMLSNAYHLYLRPGHRLIAEQGGLHQFTGWSEAVLTDSGGFQVVSLADFCKVTDEGVCFKSHIDGSLHHLTPELCMEIQLSLKSDIMMVLDECPPYPCTFEQARMAVRRSTQWAHRCLKMVSGRDQALFAIIQGGLDESLRRHAAQELVNIGFDGYALGGLSLGEEKPRMFSIIEGTINELPKDKPRYLMGVGLPEDLVEGVYHGIDLFDCVIPSRHGRTGWLFTTTGRVLIKNAQYARDDSPIDPRCGCPVCSRYSRAYLRHLFVSNEMLGSRLNTLHNLWFYANLMTQLRLAIRENRLGEFRTSFYENRRECSSSMNASMVGMGSGNYHQISSELTKE